MNVILNAIAMATIYPSFLHSLGLDLNEKCCVRTPLQCFHEFSAASAPIQAWISQHCDDGDRAALNLRKGLIIHSMTCCDTSDLGSHRLPGVDPQFFTPLSTLMPINEVRYIKNLRPRISDLGFPHVLCASYLSQGGSGSILGTSEWLPWNLSPHTIELIGFLTFCAHLILVFSNKINLCTLRKKSAKAQPLFM